MFEVYFFEINLQVRGSNDSFSGAIFAKKWVGIEYDT